HAATKENKRTKIAAKESVPVKLRTIIGIARTATAATNDCQVMRAYETLRQARQKMLAVYWFGITKSDHEIVIGLLQCGQVR
ncbi:MAG TPA: hypothetical protein VFS82_04910, partial [Lysobacter sp.]|nr:hypothetical protein [Lysobacter sp.]